MSVKIDVLGNVRDRFKQTFHDVILFVSKVNLEMKMFHTCGRRGNRANIQTSISPDYYHQITISTLFLDRIILQLHTPYLING